MKKTTRFVALSLFVALVLAACSGGGSAFLGKWEATDEELGMTFSFDFKADGTVAMDFMGMALEGTWENVDADTFNLNVEMLGLSEDTPVDFVRTGDKLTLTIAGDPLEFTRVP
jgi:hypothetical protein